MAAVGRLSDGLAGAKLDAVIVVGDDQKEIYHDDNMPSVLVYRGETIANVPNRTDARRRRHAMIAAARLVAARRRPLLRGERDPALSGRRRPREPPDRHLVEPEFDVSSANALPAGEGEGHAFGFVHRRS